MPDKEEQVRKRAHEKTEMRKQAWVRYGRNLGIEQAARLDPEHPVSLTESLPYITGKAGKPERKATPFIWVALPGLPSANLLRVIHNPRESL